VLVEEVETDVLRVVAVEEVFFVVGAAVLLELETTTGFRLLYIDNRLAPPHCEN
jgi:hypothetical protein